MRRSLSWRRIRRIAHNLVSYNNIVPWESARPVTGDHYRAGPHSVVMLFVTAGGSARFVLREHLYADLFKAAVRSYTLQRCSTALSPELFGPFARPAAHPDNACRLMPSTGHEGTVDVSGGWYDAVDYGKCVVNAGITLGTLMLSHQWYPNAVGDALQIPESGNGTSDLADEIAWELRWMAKMQDPADGGVYFKVGSLLWDGFVPPKDTKYERVVMGKSTTSALNFAAVMAQAANPGIEDDVHKDPTGVFYPDVPPAKQYMDHRDAAANNETCINCNAPLVLVLSFLETQGK